MEQWIFSCAQQLQREWPQVDRDDLDHLAQALWREPQWQRMEPSAAAMAWLEQGVTTAA